MTLLINPQPVCRASTKDKLLIYYTHALDISANLTQKQRWGGKWTSFCIQKTCTKKAEPKKIWVLAQLKKICCFIKNLYVTIIKISDILCVCSCYISTLPKSRKFVKTAAISIYYSQAIKNQKIYPTPSWEGLSFYILELEKSSN